MRRLLIVATLLLPVFAPAMAQSTPGPTAEAAMPDAYDLWREAKSLRDRGDAENVEQALTLMRAAVERYAEQQGSDGPLMPYYWSELAATATLLDEAETARAARLEQIAGLRRLGNDPFALADALDRLSWLELALEAPAEAIAAIRESRALYEAANDLPDAGRLRLAGGYLDEGVARFRLADPAAAADAYRRALDLYRSLSGGTDEGVAAIADQNRATVLSNLLALADDVEPDAENLGWREERLALVRTREPGSERLAGLVHDLAVKLREAGVHARALAHLEEALALRMALDGAPARIGSIHWERGLNLYHLRRPHDAVAAYEAAIAALGRVDPPNHSEIASLHGNIAAIHGDGGDPDARSRALNLQAAALRRAISAGVRAEMERRNALVDRRSTTARPGSHNYRMTTPTERRQPPAVTRREAVALSRTEAQKLADTIDQIALGEERAGRHEEALALRREEASLRRDLEPRGLAHAITLDNLAFNLQALGRYKESLPILERAIALGLEADPATRQSAIASKIRVGIAHNALGRYDDAMAAFEEGLEWLESNDQPDKHNLSVAYDNIASLARSLGHFGRAERISERQIEVLREHQPGSAFLATSLVGMAETRIRLSRYRDALPLIEEARAIRVALSGDESADVAETWNMEGQAWEGAEEYERSLAAYDEALRRIRASVGEETIDFAAALNNAAWALRQIGELERSESDFQRSTAIIERLLGPTHRFTGIGYTNLGILAHLRGRNEDAIRLSMRALATMTRDPRATLDEQRWTYETLSNAFRDLGDSRRAILFAKEAVNAQQKLRAANKELSAEQIQDFKNEWRRLYENLAALLIAEGRLSEAQAVLAMEKEEEFVDFIRRDASEDLTETRAALTEREENAKGAIDAILTRPMGAAQAVSELKDKQARGALSENERDRLSRLEAALDESFENFMDDVDAFLERTLAEADDVRIEVDRINLTYTQDIQYELENFAGRAALLSVASLGDTTHLFLTVPEAAIHREVKIERAELSRLIFEALNAVESRSPLAAERLKALYDVFVAPLRAEIDETGADTLMLNLQGFLRYVPFAALHDGERYLIEDYALSLFTPAARTTFEAAPRRPERSAGFGVTAAHPGFSPLPGVAQEIDAIFDGGTLSGTASLDAAFTRDSFADALRASPAIVHIASHFKLVPGRETDSFLLLGDGSPLNLAEIRRGRAFRFGGVDLLTLSACQTGRGGDSDGGEVESFGALAQRNGASAVMATLWPVADDATAQLMQAFYRNYVHGEMDKAAALRRAQIDMLRGSHAATGAGDERGAKKVSAASEVTEPADRVHPYFWSPFILMGNWL